MSEETIEKTTTHPPKSSREVSEQPIQWQPILAAMYEGIYVQKSHRQKDSEYFWYGPLRELTELDVVEIQKGLDYMEWAGLVEERDDGRLIITELGIQIRHEESFKTLNREIAERQSVLTGSLSGFTLVLALAAVIQGIAAAAAIDNVVVRVGLWVVVGILAILLLLMYKNPKRWTSSLFQTSWQ